MIRSALRTAALAVLLVLGPIPAFAGQAQQDTESRIAAETYPMAVFVTGAGVETPHGFAAGMADARAGGALTVDTPMRIASNTKTFVAATVLRLWEQGRIDLDAAIGPLLTPALDALLRADGFATDRIAVRQLLSHSAGLYDHGSDPRFIEAVLADPAHVWTREEQVRASMTWADPQSQPGTEFRYSDTGYILLGDIVERITGKSLAQSVREQLHFDRLGLATTWWEIAEPAPATATPRSRQALGETDATDVHASMDLYGGGGLLMSPRDLATFFAALFEDRVFDRPETLREMLWQGPHRGAEGYRLGIFVKQIGGRDVYWHSGFWGTLAYYDPATRTAIAGMSANQQGFRPLRTIVEDMIAAQAVMPVPAP
ncbi:serine hydrolase domain-containing protein [Sphingosinicella sp. LHD-64]|uniref:serine hydrolase domain-containing protein n=1 Tax=Sphingosinicella sp. LHD-64 TaxID=3072139 RepID=UPI0028101850|nr:serine hydrolase domain-containing protein [Sphingosinicella sp. LHD-64]MDQ8756713.1 serine hydrolase domain-containing protein [Sphingosinicella sp. LHD-64]